MTAYRPSPKLLEVLAYLREREIAGRAKADHAGDSSAADRLPPGRGGTLRTVEGIVR